MRRSVRIAQISIYYERFPIARRSVHYNTFSVYNVQLSENAFSNFTFSAHKICPEQVANYEINKFV